jgi:hypothetical protein
MIRSVGVEHLLDGASRHPQGLAPRRHLDGLEIQTAEGASAYQRFNFGDDLGREGRFEPPFLTASCEAASGVSSWVSAHCSQACQYASTCLRNSWPASTCERTTFASSPFSQRDFVLPFTTRETLK